MFKEFSLQQQAPGTLRPGAHAPLERGLCGLEGHPRLCGQEIRGVRCLEPELQSVLAAGGRISQTAGPSPCRK